MRQTQNTGTDASSLKRRRAIATAHSTSLLVVDQTPFLKKALSTCKRLRNELTKKQQKLRDFEEKDMVAFRQWLNRTHGAKISQMRELREESEAYEFILHHLGCCDLYCPEKIGEVHAELFERKANGTLYEFVPPQTEDDFDAEDADEEDWDDEESEASGPTMEEVFEEMFGDADEATKERGREDFNRFFGSGGRQAAARKDEKDPQVKACYRALAKRLHPDHSDLEESVREKRWHEMQAAYEDNDLAAMERVEAVCDMDAIGLSIKLGLARLRDLAKYHQSHLRPIRRALKEAKQDMAFDFVEQGPERIQRQVKSELEQTLAGLKQQIGYMKECAHQFAVEELADDFEDGVDAFNELFYGNTNPSSDAASAKRRGTRAPEQMHFF